jgi:hypothetical protein
MDIVCSSPATLRREKIALSVGEMPHRIGNPPFLNPEETLELIKAILEWPDSTTQPTVSDLPLMVSYIFYCVLKS